MRDSGPVLNEQFDALRQIHTVVLSITTVLLWYISMTHRFSCALLLSIPYPQPQASTYLSVSVPTLFLPVCHVI